MDPIPFPVPMVLLDPHVFDAIPEQVTTLLANTPIHALSYGLVVDVDGVGSWRMPLVVHHETGATSTTIDTFQGLVDANVPGLFEAFCALQCALQNRTIDPQTFADVWENHASLTCDGVLLRVCFFRHAIGLRAPRHPSGAAILNALTPYTTATTADPNLLASCITTIESYNDEPLLGVVCQPALLTAHAKIGAIHRDQQTLDTWARIIDIQHRFPVPLAPYPKPDRLRP